MKIFKNIRKAFIVLLGGIPVDNNDITDLVKKINEAQRDFRHKDNEFGEIYLFDFKAGYLGGFDGIYIDEDAENIEIGGRISSGSGRKKGKPQKIKVKPKDVLNELETVPTPFSLRLIDEKIAILKDKEKLIAQKYTKRELKGLIERLENRKKYPEHKPFFDKFQNTTDEKIENLTGKYELKMGKSDIFIPEFPEEAVTVMKEYTEKVKEISGKKPIFYVIAQVKDFKKAYEKRDPILLAQSPFGFYYQILGAWDKEMLLLSEL